MKDALRDFIQSNRRDFQNEELDERSAPDSPFKLFEHWFEEMLKSEILDPYAFTLATSGADGQPSARVLYMRDMSQDGLVFFTNYSSDKGQDLAENAKCCANFFWAELARQVRFEGVAMKLEEEKSDTYFNSRPRASRIGAWASDQSSELISRAELEDKVKKLTEDYEGQEVERPPFWGGYIIKPVAIEFWQGRPSRLHDRLRYTLSEGDRWNLNRLSP